MNKAQINIIAKEYVRTVKDAGIPVVAAYVIGSQVTGTAHEGSDIDICIVSPMFGKNRYAEMMWLTKLRRSVNVLIEPHPLNPLELQKKSGLTQAIKEHGILVA
jgi:predicted nucleotidyltransferase